VSAVESDTAAIARLGRYRLQHDLTYGRLAALMTAAGYPVKERALHLLLSGRTGLPRERTRYKVRAFLAHVAGGRKRSAA
jgi:hypothetical protein